MVALQGCFSCLSLLLVHRTPTHVSAWREVWFPGYILDRRQKPGNRAEVCLQLCSEAQRLQIGFRFIPLISLDRQTSWRTVSVFLPPRGRSKSHGHAQYQQSGKVYCSYGSESRENREYFWITMGSVIGNKGIMEDNLKMRRGHSFMQ